MRPFFKAGNVSCFDETGQNLMQNLGNGKTRSDTYRDKTDINSRDIAKQFVHHGFNRRG
jgi:hypothetical protein